MQEVLKVDESKFAILKAKLDGFRQIQFTNDEQIPVDLERLRSDWMSLDGRREVKYVSLGYTSLINELSCLEAFENIDYLNIQSKAVKSLAGISAFRRLSKLMLDVKIQDIAELVECTSLTSLGVEDFNKNHLPVFNRLRSLESLTLSKGVPFSIADLSDLNITSLYLRYCKAETLSDTNKLAKIEKLKLAYCRHLAAIAGENSKIKFLEITTCNNLDFSSLENVPGLIHLTVTSVNRAFDLCHIKMLKKLRRLYITHSKVEGLDGDVFMDLHDLSTVWIQGTKSRDLEKISLSIKNKVFTNGDRYFFEGGKVDFKFYEELDGARPMRQ